MDLRGSASEARRLMPGGTFDAPRGAMAGSGPWHLDVASASLLIGRSKDRSTDIVVDYEHQTLLTDQNGKPAPAAGWIKPETLEYRDDGLYGVISWTAAAKAAIDSDEYRYLSPVFSYDPNTRNPLELLHVALTNTPAINGGDVSALAAARAAQTDVSEEDDPMDLKKIAEALGLKPDADETAVMDGIAALRSGADQLAVLRKDLDIKDDDDPAKAVAALKSGAADMVPRAVFDELASTVAALKTGNEDSEKNRLIEEGLADGRISGKATADWLKKGDIAALRVFLEDAKPLAALKGLQTGGKTPEDKGGSDDGKLSDAELAVCKSMGISPEDYTKANS
ncbi:phage protease [Thalassospira alkalitolerans]|uniref:phage protease n=1 Tax=Thalassospira alkalitolerans TaxID=1293890 RepID=UPI0030EB377E|tara:strand:+ start:9711 stop:10727 length:1017 start_codon:yes stop_codon:yes gene_type:complete